MSLRSAMPITQHRGHVLLSGPAAEPVTAAELRTHLAMASDDTTTLSDDEADGLITDARTMIEEYSGLSLINQSWRMTLDRWPAGREAWWDGVRQGSSSDLYNASALTSVLPPRYPLSSITSCTVYDEDGNATSVTVADTFDVDTYSKPGRLTLKRGSVWPVALRANNAIEIVYVAGHGATASNVPGPLKRAVKHLAGYLFEHRGDACSVEDMMAKSGASGFVGGYRVQRL